MAIKIDQLPAAIANELIIFQKYTQDELEAVQMTVADAVVDIVKREGKFEDRTGEYRKSITHTKPTTKNHYTSTKIWGGSKHYRLTHLLEHGHATKNGGRTRAFPHFEIGQEWIDQHYVKEMEDRLKK